jgi:uncharacterized protein (TIGR00299 family) protein
MRIAYLDCFAGISGDMFLGALLDAGVPVQVLQDATAALGLGASLKIETVDRSGISCTKVHVLEGDSLAEEAGGKPIHTHIETAGCHGGMGEPVPVEQQSRDEKTSHTVQPKTQHLHKTGHAHTHEEEHVHAAPAHGHGRSLTQIRSLIEKAPLDEAIRTTAIRTFELLGDSEAKIHNVPVEEIHFHEVGAVDAIVDIVAASAGIYHLRIDAWHCSPINVGGGTVHCAHGIFPVPAPAAADLLRGFPTYSAHVQKELVTPTGAALLRTLNPTFGQQPVMRVERIGYGAGTRNPKDFPNVLRIHVGEAFDAAASSGWISAGRLQPHKPTHSAAMTESTPESISSDSPRDDTKQERHDTELVAVLETALDDLSPQISAYVTETALARGALDVMLTPVIMKKGRPGVLLTVLCHPSDTQKMEHLILSETSTLGVRIRHDRRSCLDRSHIVVQTEYGGIRMKVGSLAGEELNAAPEFEDCRAACVTHHVPLKQVQQAAIAAYKANRTAG